MKKGIERNLFARCVFLLSLSTCVFPVKSFDRRNWLFIITLKKKTPIRTRIIYLLSKLFMYELPIKMRKKKSTESTSMTDARGLNTSLGRLE